MLTKLVGIYPISMLVGKGGSLLGGKAMGLTIILGTTWNLKRRKLTSYLN